MGHLVQMAGLTVQNFVSAAVGMAVAVALVRGFARAATDRIGNFWVDLTRGDHPRPAADLVRRRDRAGRARRDDEPARRRRRHRRRRQLVDDRRWRPTASQEAIKELGTNGGGIFNANSAHPFENPTALTNLLRDLPAAGDPGVPDPHVRGHGARHPAGPRPARRDGRAVGRAARRRVVGRDPPERSGGARRGRRAGGQGGPLRDPRRRCCSPCRPPAPRPARSTRCTTPTPAWAAAVTLLNMLLGEVAPGGVGAGLYGILVLAVIAVFLAGLMVGRTPEYLGKKLGRTRGDRRGDLDPRHADPRAARRRRRARAAGRARRRAGQRPARTGCPRCSTPTPRRPTTTAAPSPGSP